MSEAKYQAGADGKIYQVTTNPDTLEEDYTPVAAEGMEISEDGKSLIPIRSTAERKRQLDPRSHLEHFKNKPQMSLMDEKQALRRQAAFNKMLEESVLARPKDVTGAGVKKISEEQWQNMSKDPEWVPLASYAHKIEKARPILGGELGMYRGDIYVLEGGEKFFSSGSLINTKKE